MLILNNKFWFFSLIACIAIVFGLMFFLDSGSHEKSNNGHGHKDLTEVEDHSEHEHAKENAESHQGEDVAENAEHAGHGHDNGSDEESTLRINEVSQELTGIKLEKSSARKIQTTVKLNGRIFPNRNKFAQVVSPYPGIVKKTYKSLGENVKARDVLASIEANGSLSIFSIKSKIAGTVIKNEIIPGEFVSDKEVLFEVSDLSKVWVNLSITEQDFDKVKLGQKVFIKMWDKASGEVGTLKRLHPTQAKVMRELLSANRPIRPPRKTIAKKKLFRKPLPIFSD